MSHSRVGLILSFPVLLPIREGPRRAGDEAAGMITRPAVALT